MPKLIIDNQSVEVPDGTNVLEAARSIGIVIPHFCWHPALGKAGACRVCAVKMLDGPVKGLQMSCMLPAQDGMVVSTTDEEARAMRKSVIEWLMINHPHDCPVCDEGGECQLQDFTIAGGHGIRRYDGRKRTHVNQYLGQQIEHEMNRCIQCYRCVRFYQEYAGGTDFGVMGRAASVYFGRQQDGALESPFSGNLVDICPTGVFTDKTARFRARYWDYDMAPSICPGCSLGCNTIPMARYRELLKTTARRNDQINGWFICDRGRFANAPVNAPDRPRQALVDGMPVSMDTALDALAERLSEFLELHGPEALAIVGSPRMSLEGNIMAGRLKELLGAGTLCFFGQEHNETLPRTAVSLLHATNRASQDGVRRADLVVIMACDILETAPMMALAVRQAWRNGAHVFLVGCGTTSDASHEQLFESVSVPSLADVPLLKATSPVIICGPQLQNPAAVLAAAPGTTKLAFIMEHPNSFGCAILSRDLGAISFQEAVANGKVKGFIALESDLPADLPSGIRVLAAADWLPSGLIKRSEIVLPVTTWVEMDGTFVNHEGRAQRFSQVMQPGLPIKGLTPELHPTRMHSHDIPGGDLLPAWQIVTELILRLSTERIDDPLSGPWAPLASLDSDTSLLLSDERNTSS
ncbi:MAG: NADH-quinone oxidoreductase subunit NuoG [Geobacteraceae bacterium]|nr:NADH-quinone oxidoreductase subunit NuoG [Geobacteraceae bacterium]